MRKAQPELFLAPLFVVLPNIRGKNPTFLSCLLLFPLLAPSTAGDYFRARFVPFESDAAEGVFEAPEGPAQHSKAGSKPDSLIRLKI